MDLRNRGRKGQNEKRSRDGLNRRLAAGVMLLVLSLSACSSALATATAKATPAVVATATAAVTATEEAAAHIEEQTHVDSEEHEHVEEEEQTDAHEHTRAEEEEDADREADALTEEDEHAGQEDHVHAEEEEHASGDLQRHGVPEEAASVPNPIAATEESIATGASLFATNCVACHGETGMGDGPAGANLDPSPANLHEDHVQALSDGALFYLIKHGVPGTAMPAWEEQLSEEKVWHIINFVRTLPEQ